MEEAADITPFVGLFRGRTDAFGLMQKGKPFAVRRPLSLLHYRLHLEGRIRLGVYPLLPDGRIHFLAFDFDGSESLIAARFIWRKHPLASLWAYLGIVLPLIAPVVACRALLWLPVVGGVGAPLIYMIGIYAMAMIYGLYYGLQHGRYDTLWVFGVLFVFFYLAFLIWQTYYAVLTSRNPSWGTRPSQAAAHARP